MVLLDPGTYPSATKDSVDHIYEWRTKKIYWRGLGAAPSDTVLDVNTPISGLMISARDMLFENLQFNPTSYGLLRYYSPITTGLILNKCKITNYRGQCSYSVAGSFGLNNAQIIDGGIKFINVDFPDTQAGVFTGRYDYPADLSKIYVSKCIIPDNDYYGYYLTGSFALADWVTSPTVGYGSNYGAYLITEVMQYSYLKNRRSRFDTFGRVLDVMEPCIRYLPFRGRDRLLSGTSIPFLLKGYILGGLTVSKTAVIEDLLFSNETSAAIAATLDTAKGYGSGVQSGGIL